MYSLLDHNEKLQIVYKYFIKNFLQNIFTKIVIHAGHHFQSEVNLCKWCNDLPLVNYVLAMTFDMSGHLWANHPSQQNLFCQKLIESRFRLIQNHQKVWKLFDKIK